MEKKLRDLLDKTYELEGLIYLALQRKEFSDDFTRLIIKKSKEICDCSDILQKENDSENFTKSVYQNDSRENEETVPEQQDFFSMGEYAIEEENESTDSNNSTVDRYEDNPVDSYTFGYDNSNEGIPKGNDEIFPFKNKDRGNENDNPDTQELKKGKLVFSINDRFRFKKELFDNSDIDFNNTLALVASMENFEEAEDYFLNEEGFDPSNPVVKEFLEVIKKYFK